MKKVIFLILISVGVLFAQEDSKEETYTISGRIKDDENGEDLLGASIYIKELNKGTVSNNYGFYSITLPKGEYTLEDAYLGY